MNIKYFKLAHIQSAFRFVKRNITDLKVMTAPIITITFLFFAFTGFLMNEQLNTVFVMTSRIITLLFVSTLLLYCIYDLIKSIFVTPFKNIVNREKGN